MVAMELLPSMSDFRRPPIKAENVTVTVSAPGIPDATIMVTVIDDDMQRIVADVQNLTVTEGQAGNINVQLANAPPANVTVNVTASNPAAGLTADEDERFYCGDSFTGEVRLVERA